MTKLRQATLGTRDGYPALISPTGATLIMWPRKPSRREMEQEANRIGYTLKEKRGAVGI
jgi:hypothetical protein